MCASHQKFKEDLLWSPFKHTDKVVSREEGGEDHEHDRVPRVHCQQHRPQRQVQKARDQPGSLETWSTLINVK